MSTTDATTTDGFRLGRRVRVNVAHYNRYGHEGTIKGRDERFPHKWIIDFDNDKCAHMSPIYGDHELELLPDDAPATPEPPADDILFTKQIDIGNLPELEPDVSALMGRPYDHEPDKPDHYAKLRDAGCEPFAVIRGCMSREKAVAYHQGTAIAYLIRAEHKHAEPDDDIRKAHAHLAEAVSILNSTTTSPTTQSLH